MVELLTARGVKTSTGTIANRRADKLVPALPSAGDPSEALVDHYAAAHEVIGQGKSSDGAAIALAIRYRFDLEPEVVHQDMQRTIPEFFAVKELRAMPDLSRGAPLDSDLDAAEVITQKTKDLIAHTPTHPLSEVVQTISSPASKELGLEDRKSSYVSDFVGITLGENLSAPDRTELADICGQSADKSGLTKRLGRAGSPPNSSETGTPHVAAFRGIADVIESTPIMVLVERARRIRAAAPAIWSKIEDPKVLDIETMRFIVTVSTMPEDKLEDLLGALEILGLIRTAQEIMRDCLSRLPRS